MSNINNKQPLDLTNYEGISQPDEASTTTPIGFLLGCAKKGGDRNKQCPPTICKVSIILREISESPFNPQLVSIGPIHREDPKLQEFEWLKECYLHDLLSRCNSTPEEILEDPKLMEYEWLKECYLHDVLHRDSTPEKTLEACLLEVKTLIPRIRESYAGMIERYSDDKVATMMVMDGCFILEICFKHEEEILLPNKMQNLRIAMDLMLLENQVPLFVLQALFECTKRKAPSTLSKVLDECLVPYIMLFRPLLPGKISTTDVDSDLPKKIPTTDVDSDSTHDHVLGYLHKRYQLVAAKSSNPIHAEVSKLVDEEQAAMSSDPIENAAFHSIVELDRSGMNFKPHQEGGWSMTIKFQSSLFAYLPWFKPTLLMPTLVIDDTTELILRNFIAYEQSFPKDRYYFTSYAYAMDKLIDTQEDIAKLVESKVLVNMLGSNQEAADMINKICKNMFVTDFYYTEEFKQMDTYYNGYWPKNIARLRRVYFNNPWNSIAVLAAIILFTLTVVQTVYTIRAA
ncbi:putative UPF0481 protein [Tanacetum coccineum]